ncbi:MAG: adenylate/guanylate cyclase domain-containing protein, partial [Candidatus Cloacimonetes bacterium]|nr:adenylate/guanylate cyclase domain-containing protein [Candidatus Cloacimonadota bacterium]
MNGDDLFFNSEFLLEDEENNKPSLKEGELREVSVLFADIKGFTNISNNFEPEVIHGKMDEIMKIFSKCITFYGGFVDKYIGDGIMALFGAKKATEHDTQRCILAAIKMQEQLRLYNSLLVRERGFENLELGLRVGINTGMVSVGKVGQSREGDFTVYGPQVNLASRMESNAPVNR